MLVVGVYSSLRSWNAAFWWRSRLTQSPSRSYVANQRYPYTLRVEAYLDRSKLQHGQEGGYSVLLLLLQRPPKESDGRIVKVKELVNPSI